MLGSPEAAEDVTHDCFLSLIKEPGRYDSTRASLRTYLYAAARNQAVKRYQSFGRETALDELASEVEQAIASLPPLQREALILFEYQDLSLAEIAAVVGAESGTVKSRL